MTTPTDLGYDKNEVYFQPSLFGDEVLLLEKKGDVLIGRYVKDGDDWKFKPAEEND